MLYRLLTRKAALGEVGNEILAQVKHDGIESFYQHLTEADKIYYHRRLANTYKRHRRYAEALQHYRQLLNLQMASFRVAGNVLYLKFRLWHKKVTSKQIFRC